MSWKVTAFAPRDVVPVWLDAEGNFTFGRTVH